MEAKGKWPKAIFYDSKNTLFDWGSVWTKASSNILDYRKSKMDPVEFQGTWHKFTEMVNHRVAFRHYQEFTEILRESLFYTFKHYNISGSPDDIRFMAELWNEVQPYPDTASALRKQKEITKIFIFSNVEMKYLDMMVSKLRDFRPDFVGAMDQAKALKPNPRAYHWVLKQVGLDVNDVIYCAGIPQWDVQGAMACGMKGAWVNRERVKYEGVKPDYEVMDLHGLTEIVRSLNP